MMRLSKAQKRAILYLDTLGEVRGSHILNVRTLDALARKGVLRNPDEFGVYRRATIPEAVYIEAHFENRRRAQCAMCLYDVDELTVLTRSPDCRFPHE